MPTELMPLFGPNVSTDRAFTGEATHGRGVSVGAA
jgi:hypothetical protein